MASGIYSNQRIGDLFAIMAAVSNSSIGILNKFGFASQSSCICLSFYKCLGAFAVLCALLLFRPSLGHEVWERRKDLWKLAILSFFGILFLYLFETWAYSMVSIPVVSFLTYASGIVTVILGTLFLKERMTWAKALAICLVFGGVAQMFVALNDWELELQGAIFAILGGIGYSLFLFLWKKFAMHSGLGTLFWFFGFGTLYLIVPYILDGAQIPRMEAWPSLLLLILFPTLAGYYLTSRALQLTEASHVQVIETSEPFFSSLFAFAFFGEMLAWSGFFAAAAIFSGIILLIVQPKWPLWNKAPGHYGNASL